MGENDFFQIADIFKNNEQIIFFQVFNTEQAGFATSRPDQIMTILVYISDCHELENYIMTLEKTNYLCSFVN